jgi:curved DNA-binding protein CbpA
MNEQKYQDYNPDTSDIPFKLIQEYYSILSSHFKEYKFDSLGEINKNILSIFYMNYKNKGGKANEEQFIFQMLSVLKDVQPQIYEFLIK